MEGRDLAPHGTAVGSTQRVMCGSLTLGMCAVTAKPGHRTSVRQDGHDAVPTIMIRLEFFKVIRRAFVGST